MIEIDFSRTAYAVNVFPCRHKDVAVIQKLKRSQLFASAVVAASSGHYLFSNSEFHRSVIWVFSETPLLDVFIIIMNKIHNHTNKHS